MAFGDISADDIGSALHPLFLALGSSPSNAPLASLPQAMQIAGQQQRGGMSRSALKALLIQKGYTPEQAELYSASEATAKLAIQDKQQKELLGDGVGAEPSLFGGGAPTGAPAISPSAPPGPAAGVSMNGGTAEQSFLNTLIGKESGGNANAKNPSSTATGLTQFTEGTWGDMMRLHPELGLTPGGRTDPDQAKKAALAYAQDNGKLLAENGHEVTPGNLYLSHFLGGPGSTRFLNGLRTNPNAPAASYADPAAVAANKSVFFGADGQPKTAADFYRERTSKFGSAPSAPTQVADASGQVGAPTVSPADMPATDAQPAGFVIPPGAQAAVEKQVGAPPTPVNPNIGPTTQRAQAIANFNYWGKRLRASAAFGEAGKGLMEEAKIKMGLAQKFIEPAEAERLADAAGLSGQLRADAISGAIPGNAPTAERKDFEYGQRTPGYEDYQKRMKEAGRSQVSIDQRAGGKFEEGLGTKAAERFNSYIEQGDAAKRRLGDVGILRDASRSLGSLGKSADARAAIGPYAEALGIKIEGLPDIQVFQSTAARLAPQLREPGAGATSDRDLAGFEKAIGQLSATPEAREKILDVFEAASRNQVTAAQIARDVSSGRLTRQEGEDKLQNLPDPLVAFREYQKANGQAGAPQQGVERAASAAQPAMPTGNTTERAAFISQSRAAAAAALAKKPKARDAILQRLKDAGVYTDGL